jgi:MFS family permease
VSDRAGRRTPIIAGCVFSGLPLFAVPFVSDFWILLLLVIIYGLGFATVMSSTPALISDLVPRELVGTSMGFLDTIMDVGQTLGPIISGMILGISLQYGMQYVLVFITLGLVLLFAGGLFAFLKIAKTHKN